MKIFKVLGLLILTMVSLILIVGLLFVNLSPQFGGSPTEEQTESYSKTGHYKEGVFVNELETNMDMDFSAMYETMLEFIKGGENLQPKEDLPVKKIEAQWIEQNKNQLTKLTWFGHSAFLLQLDGKKILIDPMLGESPAPHPMIGVKRYNKEIPIEIKNLPFIDFVIISHDHYDHLDYESVMKLKGKVGKFYMPLGVGTHFKSWGFDENQILELDWWDETMEDNIKLVCTPSRHFSGRGLTDRSATLWSSWVILSEKKKIYFSGDGGFGPHFKEIGDKYGLKPRAKIKGFASIGSEPSIMLTGPGFVTDKLLKNMGMNKNDIDLWELNEAFASVVLRYMDHMGIDHSEINVNGGAIAMGHPLGATGAMILGTVLDELERSGKSTALATLCVGGGMGTATVIERI